MAAKEGCICVLSSGVTEPQKGCDKKTGNHSNYFFYSNYYYYFFIGVQSMAPHSSTLAWKIPWTEEPGRLQSMVSLSETRLSDFTFTFMHWRRKRQPPPVFLPGESQGQGNLVGCCLWGLTELDTTEVTQQQQPVQLLIIYPAFYSTSPLRCLSTKNKAT